MHDAPSNSLRQADRGCCQGVRQRPIRHGQTAPGTFCCLPGFRRNAKILQKRGVSLQGLQGQKTFRQRAVRQALLNVLHSPLDFRGIGYENRHAFRQVSGQHRFQAAQAALFPGSDPNHRNPQPPGQEAQVQGKALALRLVHQVDADHHPGRDLQDLQYQHQIPLQGSGVADYDDPFRPGGTQEIPGHLLFRGVGQQGIGPRQVHQHPPMPASAGQGHGLSRPVSGVLPHTGKRIEQGAFAHIGIPGQGDAALFYGLRAIQSSMANGSAAQSHASPSTSTPALSLSRRAITAPRIS